MYTTNAIESVNARLRKIIKTHGHFPSDDAATKLIWLALRNITADWGRADHNWKSAINSRSSTKTGSRNRARKKFNQLHEIGEGSMSLTHENSDRPLSSDCQPIAGITLQRSWGRSQTHSTALRHQSAGPGTDPCV